MYIIYMIEISNKHLVTKMVLNIQCQMYKEKKMNTVKNGVNLMDGIANLINRGTLVNLTPHPVNVILDDGSNITIHLV